MEIRIEHAARGEPFDDAQFLNPKQHQRRPDVIEELDSNEQNPERDSVFLTLSCKRDAVMSNKHFRLVVEMLAAASACANFGA